MSSIDQPTHTWWCAVITATSNKDRWTRWTGRSCASALWQAKCETRDHHTTTQQGIVYQSCHESPDLVFTAHSLRQAPRRLQSVHHVLLDRTPTPQVSISASLDCCWSELAYASDPTRNCVTTDDQLYKKRVPMLWLIQAYFAHCREFKDSKL